jgi:hypothetical protein
MLCSWGPDYRENTWFYSSVMFHTNCFRGYLIIEPLRSRVCFPDCNKQPAYWRYIVTTMHEPVGIGAAVVHANWLVLASIWVAPTNIWNGSVGFMSFVHNSLFLFMWCMFNAIQVWNRMNFYFIVHILLIEFTSSRIYDAELGHLYCWKTYLELFRISKNAVQKCVFRTGPQIFSALIILCLF